jgi:tetratricopeptide (TPR) repeat protein
MAPRAQSASSPLLNRPTSGRLETGIRFGMAKNRGWTKILRSRHRGDKPNTSGLAAVDAFNRAMMLGATGDSDAAIRSYHEALQSANADLAPKIVFNIAVLRGQDLSAAASAYRAAIDTGHQDVAPKAAFNLACLLEQAGDLAGATHALRQAIKFGHKDVTANAKLKLEQVDPNAAVAITAKRGADRTPLATHRSIPRRRSQGHGLVQLSPPKRPASARRPPGHG